jgi:hypothetical protein
MIDLVQTIDNLVDKYGLKLSAIDATDVTLMARSENQKAYCLLE